MTLRRILAEEGLWWASPEVKGLLADTDENRALEWRKSGPYWTNAQTLTLYHGTTEDRLPSILEKGIIFGNFSLDREYADSISRIRREGKKGVVVQVTAPPGSIYPVFHGPKNVRTDSLSVAKPLKILKVL